MNLLSAETLHLKGLFYRNDQQIIFTKDGTTIAELYIHNNLLYLRLEKQQQQIALASSKVLSQSEGTPELWHLCTDHVCQANLIKAEANSTGMVIKGDPMVCSCNNCMEATSKRIISRVPLQRPEQPYTEVSTDIVTMSHEGIGQEQYFSLFTDSTSLYIYGHFTPTKDGIKYHFTPTKDGVKYHFTPTKDGVKYHFIPTKDGVKYHFTRQHSYTKVQLGVVTKWYRLDRGCGYSSSGLHQYTKEEGVILHVTTPHNSEQNGRAKISNHIICTTMYKLMLQGRLPKGLWLYAVQAAIYLHNIMPSNTLNGILPYQVLAEAFGWMPVSLYVGHLCVYGC